MGSSLHAALGAGWEAGGCPHEEYHGMVSRANGDLQGEKYDWGEAALSARLLLGLEGPSVKQSNSKP